MKMTTFIRTSGLIVGAVAVTLASSTAPSRADIYDAIFEHQLEKSRLRDSKSQPVRKRGFRSGRIIKTEPFYQLKNGKAVAVGTAQQGTSVSLFSVKRGIYRMVSFGRGNAVWVREQNIKVD
ncbi:hypothetical protein C1752_04530 [Acaryochloris thomasi RCC1774]|uniref:Uncharacterized protein n=1 Tax=Acaryochloris thomasi RCC1774 TaxID=1764569 RepID=A0A2W1JNV8_9CYAN|nr:hypothetical protein [Acaryochloris thomasi]PZD71834.1 hypothetical protein C1752_04530 [Acaryochloris thomasi RCC1774]